MGQSGEASRWRVGYQRSLPRLVYIGNHLGNFTLMLWLSLLWYYFPFTCLWLS